MASVRHRQFFFAVGALFATALVADRACAQLNPLSIVGRAVKGVVSVKSHLRVVPRKG